MKRLVFLCGLRLLAADPETLIRQVSTYDYGKDPSAVRELEALVHRQGASIEKLLLSGLESAKTLAAKDAFCRNLAIAGTDAAVPKLAGMLLDPNTAEMARYPLEQIPGARATTALRDALAKTSPPVQTGIVISLGRRKDTASVAAVERLLASNDPALARAAAEALGRIGNEAAGQALLRTAQTAAPIPPAVRSALLTIAERSNPEIAQEIHARVRLPAQLTLPAMVASLPKATEREQVQTLAAIADSGDAKFRPVLVESASNASEAVRALALTGLAKLGTAAELPLLAGRAANASGDEQAAARAALGSIRGDAFDAAVLQAIPSAEPTVKVELIRAVGARGIVSAQAVLLAAAGDASRPVRVESIRALRETAGAEQVPALLALLTAASTESDRREIERTTASAIRRTREANVSEVLAAYRRSTDTGVRISLMNVLSSAGNSAALPAIRQALGDPDATVQRAALNALSGWPTPEPMDDLLALARSGSPAQRILALRGYIQLVQIPSTRTPAETARLLKTAFSAATRADEKRAMLAVAQRLVCPESLELAKTAAQDAEVSAEAKLAVTTLERGLSFLKR